jgi:hypothetical protein
MDIGIVLTTSAVLDSPFNRDSSGRLESLRETIHALAVMGHSADRFRVAGARRMYHELGDRCV